MEVATTGNALQAVQTLNTLKENVTALEIAIKAMRQTNEDEKYIQSVVSLKHYYESRRKTLEIRLENIQVELY